MLTGTKSMPLNAFSRRFRYALCIILLREYRGWSKTVSEPLTTF